jgi:hypothetical protein
MLTFAEADNGRMRTTSAARFTAALACTSLLSINAAPAAAQDESTLRSFFEGTRVTVTIDMPGSSDGVDLHVDSGRPLDYQRYGDRLRAYGAAIRADHAATVTLVKLKKDVIEFQLDGGGFGTFNDDANTSVSIPRLEKSTREKSLEKEAKDEDNPRRRRELERQLDELRTRREVENRRIDVLKAEAEERRKERIAEQRLRGGSRFNLRYDEGVPRGIAPREVMAALGSYVTFSALTADDRQVDDGIPRKGMMRAQAERAFGIPIASSERQEGTLQVTTLVFNRGTERITADFVEDVLVRYVTTAR